MRDLFAQQNVLCIRRHHQQVSPTNVLIFELILLTFQSIRRDLDLSIFSIDHIPVEVIQGPRLVKRPNCMNDQLSDGRLLYGLYRKLILQNAIYIYFQTITFKEERIVTHVQVLHGFSHVEGKNLTQVALCLIIRSNAEIQLRLKEKGNINILSPFQEEKKTENAA
ncbi:hypothetical protein ACJX0J_030692 [Zea mays]